MNKLSCHGCPLCSPVMGKSRSTEDRGKHQSAASSRRSHKAHPECNRQLAGESSHAPRWPNRNQKRPVHPLTTLSPPPHVGEMLSAKPVKTPTQTEPYRETSASISAFHHRFSYFLRNNNPKRNNTVPCSSTDNPHPTLTVYLFGSAPTNKNVAHRSPPHPINFHPPSSVMLTSIKRASSPPLSSPPGIAFAQQAYAPFLA